MLPFVQNLTLADGQVMTAAAPVLAGIGNAAGRYNLTFANVGGQEETLLLTLARNGGPQRRLKRVVLEADEQLEIGGLPLNLSDVLYAQTTDPASVDYTASFSGSQAPPTMRVYDNKGGVKTAPYILEQLDSITGNP